MSWQSDNTPSSAGMPCGVFCALAVAESPSTACKRQGRRAPEVEQLSLLEVAHRAAMRALHVVRHNLQVGLHLHMHKPCLEDCALKRIGLSDSMPEGLYASLHHFCAARRQGHGSTDEHNIQQSTHHHTTLAAFTSQGAQSTTRSSRHPLPAPRLLCGWPGLLNNIQNSWAVFRTLTVARGTSRRLRLSCAASVFCAARSTRTLPSNTPRPLPLATMHLRARSGSQPGQANTRRANPPLSCLFAKH